MRFMGCMESDGDLNSNLSTVWKGQVKRVPDGHPAVSRTGGTPRTPYHLHWDSFRYIVKTDKKLHETYTVTLVLYPLMHILSKYEKQIL